MNAIASSGSEVRSQADRVTRFRWMAWVNVASTVGAFIFWAFFSNVSAAGFALGMLFYAALIAFSIHGLREAKLKLALAKRKARLLAGRHLREVR